MYIQVHVPASISTTSLLPCQLWTVYACAAWGNITTLNIQTTLIACIKCTVNDPPPKIHVLYVPAMWNFARKFTSEKIHFNETVHVNDVVLDWSYALAGFLVSTLFGAIFQIANVYNTVDCNHCMQALAAEFTSALMGCRSNLCLWRLHSIMCPSEVFLFSVRCDAKQEHPPRGQDTGYADDLLNHR